MRKDTSRFNCLRVRTLLLIVCGVFLFSCGMYEQGEVTSTGDTGSVTFSVRWVPSGESSEQLPMEAASAQPLAATDICTVYGITQVHLEIWKDGTTPTSTGVSATAACTDHTATMAGVPAQVADLYVKLTTTPPGWEGESARFTLSSGGTQDLGEIYVKPPPQWHTAESIGIIGADTGVPEISMDDSGNAIAVWKQGTDRIYAIRFSPGAGWDWVETQIGPAEVVIGGYENTFGAPRIAMAANGEGIVIWREQFYSLGLGKWQNRVNAKRYTPTSNNWELADHISSIVESEDDIRDWNIAMDDSGNAVVVWSMNTNGATGTVYDIFASRYSASSDSWAGTRLTALAAGNNALNPHVAMAGGGSAMIVWEENTGEVYGQRFDGAAWENTPAVIGTWSSAVLSADPQVAMDGSGNAIVLWRSYQTSYPGPGALYSQRLSANRYAASAGAWGDTNSIVEIGGGPMEDGHRIVMDKTGNAFAFWTYSTSGTFSAAARRYQALTGLWELNTSGTGGLGDVGMDDNGNAIVVYTTPYFSTNVLAEHYDASTFSWGSMVTVYAGDTQGGPKIAVNGAGEAMAVWTHNDGSWIRPYANRYY